MFYILPLRDNNPVYHPTPVTQVLIVLNILVYLLMLLGPAGFHHYILQFGLIPREIVSHKDLLPPTPLPWPSTMFTHMFMHGGLMHLGGNMLFLFIFGNNVEDVMGSWRFLLFYLLVGLGASLVHVLLNAGSTIPLVGASGAISGILGAYMLRFPRARIDLGVFFFLFLLAKPRVPAAVVLGVWIMMQLFGATNGMESGVAYGVHIAGFILGMLLMKRFERPLYRRWSLRQK